MECFFGKTLEGIDNATDSLPEFKKIFKPENKVPETVKEICAAHLSEYEFPPACEDDEPRAITDCIKYMFTGTFPPKYTTTPKSTPPGY
ncbi:hypothetical protein C0J52_23836 [Blattella germanica]|nr:hypothetical protein C0J52_23836 [Blattella germanica]